MNNLLKTFAGTMKFVDAQPELIQAVQQQLIKVGLLHSIADGVPGPQTLAAFAKFKKLEYLEHPTILGNTTAQVLLNATELHPYPNDTAIHDVKSAIRFPLVGVVGDTQLVPGSNYFTWGELTKGLTRVPESSRVVRNLIDLVQYLDRVRQQLGDRPITITSGYRPSGVNRAVNGVVNSRHLFGDAADIITSLSPHEVYQRLNAWHGNRGGLGDSVAFTHIDLRGYRARWNYGNA